MGLRQLRVGSLPDVFQYDDADFDAAIDTDHGIRTSQSPSNPDDVVRLTDLEGATSGSISSDSTISDNAIVTGDGGSRKVQGSLVSIDDSGNIIPPASATVDGVDLSDASDLRSAAGLSNHNYITVSANGEMTNPTQPAFLVTTDGGLSNVTGAGTIYTVAWGIEVFDQNNDFASPYFTAPVDGKYQLNFHIRFAGITAAADYLRWYLVTSNRTHTGIWSDTDDFPDAITCSISVVADMDANDVAYVRVLGVGESADIWDISSGYNAFSGCLLS